MSKMIQEGDDVRITGGQYVGREGVLVSVNERTAKVDLMYEDGVVTVDANYIRNLSRLPKFKEIHLCHD